MAKTHLYPIIPTIDEETQLYTQRRKNSESPTNYRFDISLLMSFFEQQGFIQVKGASPFTSDAFAAAGGVGVGEYYEVGIAHEEGATEGTIKKRII